MTYPDAKPVRCRFYRLNDEMKSHKDKQLDQLLEADVIMEDNGLPFASPVKKRCGNYRFFASICVI